MKNPFREYMNFAIETAHAAGRLTLGYFQTELSAEFKQDDTPVTIADKRAEELIRSKIEKKYPDHMIVGEEYGAGKEKSEFCWIIDPIDGTKSFVRGVPLFAVLIGLEIAGRCEVGVAYFPALEEMIYAATGEGCYWNGRQARVSQKDSLNRSFVSHTNASSFKEFGREKEWRRVQEAFYNCVGWSDAYGHALVATGRVELMLDPTMNVWDCAPFPPILREAGGFFGDWSGNETIYANEGMSTTKTLLPQVLNLIRGE
ncbi:MAG: inositol monophosphatase family protein [Deltaproteobacteria bacterium]|nr:inositol monophosphatase family protein [Deltaproteobacteria bacterium]